MGNSNPERDEAVFEDAYPVAVRLLSRREHSELEIRRKLSSRGFSQGLVTEVITALQADGYLSDNRFADEYVRMRAGKGYGPNRIRAELAERGIDDSVLESALSAWEGDWEQLAARVREKKYGERVPTDWDSRVKQSRFLQYRGFGSEQISKVLRD